MEFKVEYASERREVWKWYCRAWRRDLWKFHAIVVAVVAFLFILLRGGAAPTLSIMLAGLGCGILSVAWMPVVPLLLFQRELRSVELDQDGISTTIAGESFRRSWRDMDSVTEEDGYIVLQGRKGAFLVPPRAFESPEQQQRFLSFALEALGASWASTA